MIRKFLRFLFSLLALLLILALIALAIYTAFGNPKSKVQHVEAIIQTN